MRFIKRYENASFIQFIKRHKVLFGLFLISIALMIKNSPIPYFLIRRRLYLLFLMRQKESFYQV